MKKSILIFTDWYEPGYKAGGPIRSCVNFVAHIYEDYDLYVYTSDRDLGEKKRYTGIEIDKWIKQPRCQIFYASPDQLSWKRILHQIKEIQPDFLYLNSMFSRYFTVYPLLYKRCGLIDAKIVLAPRGMLKVSAIHFKRVKKNIFLKILILLKMANYISFQATDDTELNDIIRWFGDTSKIIKAANFPPLVVAPFEKIYKQSGKLKMVIIGRIHPVKNLDFALRILKFIKNEIVLTIVGKVEDPIFLKKCEEIISNLPKNIKVEFKNEIKHEEVLSLIRQHHLFVSPTLGENFGHAIFEALSDGRPVLISDQTPWRDLSAYHAGWDLPLKDENAFIQAIENAAEMDDATYQQWSKGAWNYGKKYADSEGLKGRYLDMFS